MTEQDMGVAAAAPPAAAAPGVPAGGADDRSRRVYVGNLSWQTTWQELKDHMRQVGEVMYADIFFDEMGRSKGCGIVEYRSGAEAKQACDTLTDSYLQGRPIFVREDREERYYRGGPRRNAGGAGADGAGAPGVPPAGAPGMPVAGGMPPAAAAAAAGAGGGAAQYGDRKGKQLYVGNLAWSTTWQTLKDHFRDATGNNVLRADVAQDFNGRSKGFGTILFETEEGAQKAIEQLNDTELEGRKILVKYDQYV